MKQSLGRFRKANPVDISDVLGSVVKELHCETDLYFEQLKKQWENIVGSANAKNTRPVSLVKGVLTIAVSSPVWLTQSLFYKSSFIKKVNDYNPVSDCIIYDIKFVLDKSQ